MEGMEDRPEHKQHEKPLKMYEIYEGNGSLLYVTSDSYSAVGELQDDDYIVERLWEPQADSMPKRYRERH